LAIENLEFVIDMTYTTLSFNGAEKALADWGIGKWRREALNQAGDTLGFDLFAATDAAEIFPYGAMISIKTGRIPASGLSSQVSGLPLSGCTAWTGGRQWFVGWRVENVRSGSAAMEGFAYKFAGPWEFFFERLVFMKLWLTWSNGLGRQIADWRSQVVLGQSVTALTGAGDTVAGTTQTNLMTISQQVKEIAQYCIAQSSYEQTVNGLGWPAGGQIQFDALATDANGNYLLQPTASANCGIPDFVPGYEGASGDTPVSTSGVMLRAPLDAVNDLTCAECLRRQLRWIGAVGSPVVWFDYTTTPPTLKVSTRDKLPGVTLAFPEAGTEGTQGTHVESVKIQRRDDLVPAAVAFKYRVSGTIGGVSYTVIENDVAATVDGAAVEGYGQYGSLQPMSTFLPGHGGDTLNADAQAELPLQARRFSSQVGTFDFEGVSASQLTGTIQTASLNLQNPSGGGAALACWLALFPDLANVSGLAFYNDPDGTVMPLVRDANGVAINVVNFPNILLDGNVCPWMFLGNSPANAPANCVQATITAYFSYQDNASPATDTAVNTGTVQCHTRTIKVKLTNLTSGTYQSQAVITDAGEPIPYGLAGYIYGIETIPQYQGSITLVEPEISDACPIGNGLNLSGGLADWETMNACVQQVNYDDTGRTEIIFGPAQHMGPADLVERLRVNRGPRWLYLIGSDQMNRGGSGGGQAIGQHVPVAAPSAGNKVNSDLLLPQSLSDLQGHIGTYATALPGVYAWAKGLQRTGLTLLDNGPGMLLSSGTGGTLDQAYVKISVAQLMSVIGNQPVQFYELNTCEGEDATTYRTFLCTGPYHHS
jgi:hypothetical protein